MEAVAVFAGMWERVCSFAHASRHRRVRSRGCRFRRGRAGETRALRRGGSCRFCRESSGGYAGRCIQLGRCEAARRAAGGSVARGRASGYGQERTRGRGSCPYSWSARGWRDASGIRAGVVWGAERTQRTAPLQCPSSGVGWSSGCPPDISTGMRGCCYCMPRCAAPSPCERSARGATMSD